MSLAYARPKLREIANLTSHRERTEGVSLSQKRGSQGLDYMRQPLAARGVDLALQSSKLPL